jgi:hypothetical protein
VAEPFSFTRQWREVPFSRVVREIAECHCRPAGSLKPRFVLCSESELRSGHWKCPHEGVVR